MSVRIFLLFVFLMTLLPVGCGGDVKDGKGTIQDGQHKDSNELPKKKFDKPAVIPPSFK